MKKKFNKGFLLAETIAVSAIVVGTLITIYVQFININKSYQQSFKYNTVDKLYYVDTLVDFISSDVSFANLKEMLTGEFIDLKTINYCDNITTEPFQCDSLFDTLRIENILFSIENPIEFKININNYTEYSSGFRDYIKALYTDDEVDRQRLIVEFNDGTYASLKI